MTYGMRIYDTDGTTVYYDSSSQGGIFVEFLTLFTSNSTATSTITYDGTNGKPDLKGRALKVITLYSGDVAYNVIDAPYSYSYPQIEYKQTSAGLSIPIYNRNNTTIMVLAR